MGRLHGLMKTLQLLLSLFGYAPTSSGVVVVVVVLLGCWKKGKEVARLLEEGQGGG